MRADGDIQFAPVDMPEAAPPPDWLTSLFEFLAWLFSPVANVLAWSWPVLFWVIIAAIAALVIFAIYRLVDPAGLRLRSRSADEQTVWAPDQHLALALLEQADALAASGQFDEATHLLLQRSVGQIAQVRPDLVDPSSTAREIAALPALPEAARAAFATIAERVERSLFALRSLSAEDWQVARTAYADFALGYGSVENATGSAAGS
ncbi:hypothetical protein GCM10009127_06920 [Alteraurantiacibacter aestuarii]|uniref:DUF4129 domain-containing protein n=2 Tax=Alteraurantiacibacter aestuarii TaxID=650004 RepID=A0A844ZUE4_9SPHN|nr:hypothetical protein [Alteraurantiacibacter aestuarii]MXO89169.1 hypothetical protein [Alteraurantiacibacter aestuarii]